MHAKVVSVSKPTVEGVDTAEEFIAYAARVSNPANQHNKETADKLIRYLMKNKHWSPLEMVSVTMEIETTRDIGRQILRHASNRFQEFSQRYAEATEFTFREARLQDTKNRQNSLSTDDSAIHSWWNDTQREVADLCFTRYKEALDLGIAKEQARALLPEGLTVTKMYMAGTLRSWVHYIDLRAGNGTQAEHMEIAVACQEALREHFPNVLKAMDDMKELSAPVEPPKKVNPIIKFFKDLYEG